MTVAIASASSFLSNFCSLAHATTFITSLQSLESTFATNLVKDESAKNALIDTAIDYLQSLKTPTTPAAS